MERESFENDEVADLLNESFITIKVDREERPDIDRVYMYATELLTGRGGWPNSVWLTPDGRPWFAGTYFPPEGRPGLPGFKALLRKLAALWRDDRDTIETQADRLSAAIGQTVSAGRGKPVGRLDRTVVDAAVQGLRTAYDRRHGGFGDAPKFAPHGSLRLIFYEYRRTGDRSLREMAVHMLDAMARGGIRDHLAGGFHRYSTDGEWLVPHFEKMLYDNAQLARAYVDSYLTTGDETYRDVAKEVCDWVLREMTDSEGGFHAAVDAESEGEEGKFYLWTYEEVLNVLGREEGKLFCRVYGVSQGGNFRDVATGRLLGTSVLHLLKSLEGAAEEAGIQPSELAARLTLGRKQLLDRRNTRVRPRLDDKALAGWNGLMIGSLAYAGRHLNEPGYTEAAARAADFVLSQMQADGRLVHIYRQGVSGLKAYLEDYAFVADGLLELHEATGEHRYVDEAQALIQVVMQEYSDPAGGFFMTSRDHGKLLIRPTALFDGATPSGNGVAAQVLLRLARLTGRSTYLEVAAASLEGSVGLMLETPRASESLILATAMYVDQQTAKSGGHTGGQGVSDAL
jgi:uncharacterized protein YyaL (SSP411 family)